MANLALTASLVVPDEGYSWLTGIAGEAVTRGQLVYLKASDTRYWVGHCETSAATAAVSGISLVDAAAGQPIIVMTGGIVTIGATVAVGTLYLLSTAGLFMPHGDIATSDWITYAGVGTTAAKIKLGIHVSGVQKAA